MNTVQSVLMDALFQGDVVVDDAGCVRLASPDRHTVIWPQGFNLQNTIEGMAVFDAEGREIGRLGGHFQFGGGEVAELHSGIPLDAATRAAARESCPGRYWIVGQTNP